MLTEKQVKMIAEAAAVQVLQALGITAGEISRNKALKVYGVWFRDAEAAGRVRPVRQGAGRTGTKWYAVQDILAARAADMGRAEAQLQKIGLTL